MAIKTIDENIYAVGLEDGYEFLDPGNSLLAVAVHDFLEAT
jgi:hypothetical protein